nr:hypothetical protein [Tanacetum cinerariifolium]
MSDQGCNCPPDHFLDEGSPDDFEDSEMGQDVVRKILKDRDSNWLGGANMLKETSEEHSIRKNHDVTSSDTLHPFDNDSFLLFKYKLDFENYHLIRIKNNMFLLDFAGYARRSFIKDGITNSLRIFNERQVDWIGIDGFGKGCNRPFDQEHTYTLTRDTKNSRKFFKTEANVNIVDNTCNGENLVQVLNELKALMELKDEYGESLLIDV